jgi:hypothetical protein
MLLSLSWNHGAGEYRPVQAGCCLQVWLDNREATVIPHRHVV